MKVKELKFNEESAEDLGMINSINHALSNYFEYNIILLAEDLGKFCEWYGLPKRQVQYTLSKSIFYYNSKKKFYCLIQNKDIAEELIEDLIVDPYDNRLW